MRHFRMLLFGGLLAVTIPFGGSPASASCTSELLINERDLVAVCVGSYSECRASLVCIAVGAGNCYAPIAVCISNVVDIT